MTGRENVAKENIARFLRAFDRLSNVFSSMGTFSGKISLGKPELLALDCLLEQREIIMSRLAKTLNIGMSTATGLVDRLVEKNIVERIRNGGDRRVVKIALTAKGEDIARTYQEQKKQVFGKLIGALPPKDQEALVRYFEKIADVVSEEKS